MGIQDIIIFLGAIIIASLIIGFFLSQQLNRKYEDAKKNDANS